MPLLIGALGDEQLAVAAELTPFCPQAIAQRRLLRIEMLGPASENTPSPSRAARDALSAGAAGARTVVSSCLRSGEEVRACWRDSDDHGLAGFEMRLNLRAQIRRDRRRDLGSS